MTLVKEYPVKKAGNDVPCLIPPGWGISTKHIKKFIQHLVQSGHSVIAYDRSDSIEQKHPRSEKENAEVFQQVLSQLDHELIDIIAYSEGGIFVPMAVVHDTSHIRNIVYVSPAGIVPRSKAEHIARFCLEGFLSLPKCLKTPRQMLPLMNALLLNANLMSLHMKRSMAEIGEIAGSNVVDLYRTVRKKGIHMALVHGQNDVCFPMEKTVRSLRPIVAPRIYEAPDLKHYAIIAQPRLLAKWCLQALDDLEYDFNTFSSAKKVFS